jgi:hypothetical protein
MKYKVIISLMIVVFSIVALLSNCSKDNFPVPALANNVNDIGVCEIPKKYPYLFEPYLAVHSSKVAIGFIGLTSDPSSIIYKRRVFYTNLNKTISPAEIQYGSESSTGGADPCLDFDANGVLYTVNLVNYVKNSKKYQAIHFNKFNYSDMSIIGTAEIGVYSNDGITANLTRQPDKCWIKVNKVNGHIYIAWSGIGNDSNANIYFVKSEDGGTTFTEPVTIADDGSDNFYVQIEVLNNGNIILVWDVRGKGVLKSVFSTDGGNTFSIPTTLYTNPSGHANKETMGPVLTKNADGSLNIAVSILKNNTNFSSIVLKSFDGLNWNQIGHSLNQVLLSTSYSLNGKEYLLGYSLSKNQAQYNYWEFSSEWQPKLIKLSNTDGFKLIAGDYIGNVVEGNSVYSAYTFTSKNGERKIYVSEINF